MKRVLIIPDCHIPYHNKKAWNLVLKVAKKWNPDVCVVLGDWVDFYSVSSHQKTLERRNFKQEISLANKEMDKLDKALGNSTKKVYIAGNHENRLERYLMDKAPDLLDFVKPEELLKLGVRNWEYVSYRRDFKIGNLYLTHDIGHAGKNAAFRAADVYQANIVTGHTHRMIYVAQGNIKGRIFISTSFGWLGDWKQAEYMHRAKSVTDWTLGFGVAYIENDGTSHIRPIPIIKGKCVVDGKIYS